MTSLFTIGLNSLFASQYAISVASQNLANKDNASYSRRVVDLRESWSRWQLSGVNVADVRRVADDVINRRLLQRTSEAGRAGMTLQNLQSLEQVLENSGNNTGTQINETLNALKALNASPASAQSRQLYILQLQNLASRFNGLDKELREQGQNAVQSLQNQVSFINETTQKIATLNDEISTAGHADNIAPLLDERDRLLSELSKRIGFSMQEDDRHRVSLTLANGLPLVQDVRANTLFAYPSPTGEPVTEIGIEVGGVRQAITSGISEGEIGSLLAWQRTTLTQSRNSLDRLALLIADKINAQNHLGVDLQGNLGGDIFTDINSDSMKAARSNRDARNQSTATPTIEITDAAKLEASEYSLFFDSPGHFQLVRKSDLSVVQSGTLNAFPATIDGPGFRMTLPADDYATGDRFTLSPTHGGAGNLKVVLPDASRLALAFPVTANTGAANKGSGAISITEMLSTATDAFSTPKTLSPPLRIEFITPTSFRLLNATDNSVIEDNIAYDPAEGLTLFPTAGGYDPGFRVAISGEMEAQDSFSITYNLNDTANNRNGQAMEALFDLNLLDNSSLNFVGAWNALKSDVSTQTWSADIVFKTQEGLFDQAEAARHQVSGVSMEEELMHIDEIEKTFRASAQILTAASEMFDVIIGIARRT